MSTLIQRWDVCKTLWSVCSAWEATATRNVYIDFEMGCSQDSLGHMKSICNRKCLPRFWDGTFTRQFDLYQRHLQHEPAQPLSGVEYLPQGIFGERVLSVWATDKTHTHIGNRKWLHSFLDGTCTKEFDLNSCDGPFRKQLDLYEPASGKENSCIHCVTKHFTTEADPGREMGGSTWNRNWFYSDLDLTHLRCGN